MVLMRNIFVSKILRRVLQPILKRRGVLQYEEFVCERNSRLFCDIPGWGGIRYDFGRQSYAVEKNDLLTTANRDDKSRGFLTAPLVGGWDRTFPAKTLPENDRISPGQVEKSISTDLDSFVHVQQCEQYKADFEEEAYMTGGEIIYNILKTNNTKNVFGYAGGAVLSLIDCFHDGDIEIYNSVHEQCVGHAATGAGKSTGRPGVVIVSSGPGMTNLVTPLQDAYMDSVPMVVISGQVPTHLLGTDAFQECPATEITKACTKWNYLVKDINLLPWAFHTAFKIAMSGRKGPVHIDCPKDVLAGSTYISPFYLQNPPLTPSFHMSKCRSSSQLYTPNLSGRSRKWNRRHGHKPTHENQPEEEENLMETVEKCADMINKSERPVLYVGHGAVDAHTDIKRLAIDHCIPITTTVLGMGIFDERHPLSLHMVGMHGSAYANYAIQEADLIIAIGCRFDDRTTGILSKYAPKAKEAERANIGGIIHFDIDAKQVGKLVKPTLSIKGDCLHTVPLLFPFLRKINTDQLPLSEMQQSLVRSDCRKLYSDTSDNFVRGEQVHCKPTNVDGNCEKQVHHLAYMHPPAEHLENGAKWSTKVVRYEESTNCGSRDQVRRTLTSISYVDVPGRQKWIERIRELKTMHPFTWTEAGCSKIKVQDVCTAVNKYLIKHIIPSYQNEQEGTVNKPPNNIGELYYAKPSDPKYEKHGNISQGNMRNDGILRRNRIFSEMRCVSTAEKKKFFVATGVGNHQMMAAQFIRWTQPRQMITSGGLGVMGSGLPYAVGTQISHPDSLVILIDGDGSFNMTCSDLQSVRQYNLPIKIAIMNDGSLQMVKIWQKLFFNERYKMVHSSHNPDYCKLAAAYGINSLSCDNADDLSAVVDSWISNPGPMLVDFKVQSDICLPMVQPGKGLHEMLLTHHDVSNTQIGGTAPS